MVTKEQAVAAEWRDEFTKTVGAKVYTARVNGKCKTWKTRPDEFRLPMKYGLYECFYIDNSNAHEWEPR